MKQVGLFVLVFCAVASAGQVTDNRTGWHRRPETDDQDLLRYLQDTKDKMARMEQRLEEQDVRIAKQDHTIEHQNTRIITLNTRVMKQDNTIVNLNTRIITLNTRVIKQDNTIENLNTRIEEEKQISTKLTLTISEQQRVSEDLRARMLEQERVIQELRDQLEHRREDFVIPEKFPQPSQDGAHGKGLSQDNAVSGPQRAFQRAVNKRSDDLDPIVSHLSQQVTELTAQIQALKTADDEIRQARGTSYIRWGHAGCPQSSELVYSGIIGGTKYNAVGGAGNYLCLTSHPVFDNHAQPSGHGYASIYGSEYENCPEIGCQSTPACAACLVPRASSVMIPGTNRCSPGWTLEYTGYIMASIETYTGTSEFVCVDASHGNYGGASGSTANDNENVMSYTHARCGALPCPPYVNNAIVTCVVCSK